MISILDLLALLLGLSAAFGFLNSRLLGLPHTIGLLVLGLLSSLLLIFVDLLFPQQQLYEQLTKALTELDFTSIVINGMLAFLLFAGALTVNFTKLRARASQVAYLAIVGTVISTGLIGFLFWGAAQLVGLPVSLPWALVFGALISPTDPVAVLSILKDIGLKEELKTETEGESLFNDGVGIVLFTVLLGIAATSESPSFAAVSIDLLREAGGGIVLGLVTGYVAYRAIRAIDDFPVEVLITLALVAGTYAVAQKLGVSGPLATVAAGLLVGERAPRDAMSETTETYVSALWTLIDEVLNSVLFLLIGLEVLVIDANPANLILAGLAIPIALFARTVAVGVPLLLPLRRTDFDPRHLPFLTWAAVRGGISVALALSLPLSDARAPILAATYAVVIFTLVVQGLTLKPVIRWLGLTQQADPPH